MSRHAAWLVAAAVFVVGLLLGYAGAVLGPDLGLAAVYGHRGGWTLLGYAAVALLILAVPVGYIVWLIAGAVQFARSTELTEVERPLHFIRHGQRNTVRQVLVSTRGGRHASFGLHLATKIAGAGEGTVTLFRVVPMAEEADTEAEERALRQMAETVAATGVPVYTRVVQSPSVVDAVLEETRQGEYNLLIIGASDEGTVQRLLFGSVPDALAERTPCPVLIVRGAGGGG